MIERKKNRFLLRSAVFDIQSKAVIEHKFQKKYLGADQSKSKLRLRGEGICLGEPC
jgi:hypothetical protein